MPPCKCFIVEDEPCVRDVFYSALAGGAVELAGFASAQELLEAWGPEHPDMIFLDIALYRSDAIDVIRTLAARRFGGAVQLVSGLDRALHEQVKRVGEQHGLAMLPPLAKPFRAAQIQAVVQNYFAQKRRDGDAATPANGDADFGLTCGAGSTRSSPTAGCSSTTSRSSTCSEKAWSGPSCWRAAGTPSSA